MTRILWSAAWVVLWVAILAAVWWVLFRSHRPMIQPPDHRVTSDELTAISLETSGDYEKLKANAASTPEARAAHEARAHRFYAEAAAVREKIRNRQTDV